MKQGFLKNKLGAIPNGWKKCLMPKIAWFQEGPGFRNWQFKDDGIKLINITNMINGVLDLSKTTRHISWDEFNSRYKHFECKESDIVIASSGNSYCKHAIVRKQDLPLVMNTSVIRFQPLKDVEYDFLNQFLKSSSFKEQIDFMITGGAQPNFGPIHLNKVVLAIPPLPEQKKIAEILSTVDAKIEIIDQQVSKTQELKKGLMQRLLTKGIGHTEFKETKLGEIFEIKRGRSPIPIKDFITESKDGLNWIKIGDTKKVNKYIYSTKERIRKEGLKKLVLVKENDFILSNSMSFGKPYIMKTEGGIHEGWQLLKRKSEDLSIEFMYYMLSSEVISKQFKSKVAGSTVNNLTINLVSTVRVLIPSPTK